MFNKKDSFWWLSIAALCISLQAKSQSIGSSNAQKSLTQMLEGVSNRNMSMIRQYTTPDCLILEDGHLYNLDSIAKHVAQQKRMASTRVNHIYFATTRIDGNTAWLAFTDIADITEHGKTTTEHYLESAFLTKVNCVWKVQMIHSTTIAVYVK